MGAMKELVQLLWAWVRGEGDLAGLLIAWLEVIGGEVVTDEPSAA